MKVKMKMKIPSLVSGVQKTISFEPVLQGGMIGFCVEG